MVAPFAHFVENPFGWAAHDRRRKYNFVPP